MHIKGEERHKDSRKIEPISSVASCHYTPLFLIEANSGKSILWARNCLQDEAVGTSAAVGATIGVVAGTPVVCVNDGKAPGLVYNPIGSLTISRYRWRFSFRALLRLVQRLALIDTVQCQNRFVKRAPFRGVSRLSMFVGCFSELLSARFIVRKAFLDYLHGSFPRSPLCLLDLLRVS